MFVLRSVTSEVSARRGDTALLGNLVATLGLLVIGYPLAPVTIKTMLLCWITIASGVTQIVFGRQFHKTRSAVTLETVRARKLARSVAPK
jgi:uncharacterized membrane protein HdeD (DUF308 family)